MEWEEKQVDYLEQEERESFYDEPYTPIMRPDAASCSAVTRRLGLFTGFLGFFGSMYLTNCLYGHRATLGRYVRTGIIGALVFGSAAAIHGYNTLSQCKPCNREVSRVAAKHLPRFS
eukprot:jgi/Galph1/2486/GphlegSOOS_G1165.1